MEEVTTKIKKIRYLAFVQIEKTLIWAREKEKTDYTNWSALTFGGAREVKKSRVSEEEGH